jgi:hypothetical protein
LLPPGTDNSDARRQLRRTLGSRRARRPTPVCTPICTTCGQVGGWRRVDMWRPRGTPRRHVPSPRTPPARTAPTGCGQKKVTNKIAGPPHESQRVAVAQQPEGRWRRTTRQPAGRTRQRTPSEAPGSPGVAEWPPGVPRAGVRPPSALWAASAAAACPQPGGNAARGAGPESDAPRGDGPPAGSRRELASGGGQEGPFQLATTSICSCVETSGCTRTETVC